MVGPALALLAGFLVVIVLSGIALRRDLTRPLRVTWPLRERLVLVVSYAAGFGAAHAVEAALPSTFALPLCLLAGALAYAAALLLCGGFNQRDRQRLVEVIEWGRSRLGRGGGGPPVSPSDAGPSPAVEAGPTGTAPATAPGTVLRSSPLGRRRD
jgi:hypothetical protein